MSARRILQILRRITYELEAVLFGFGLVAVVVLSVWILQGKL